MTSPPISTLTFDAFQYFLTKLNHDDLDVISVVDKKFSLLADSARSKARLMTAHTLNIEFEPSMTINERLERFREDLPVPGKICASIDKEQYEYGAIVAQFLHSQSKPNSCKKCRDLNIMNSKEIYPDINGAINFVNWATTRYVFSTIRLCLNEIELDDVFPLLMNSIPRPYKYPIEALDISISLGESQQIVQFQDWILSIKPQNLILHTADSDSSIGALADIEFLDKLALSVDPGRESTLELSHKVHEWVMLASPTNNFNFLHLYTKFSSRTIRFSVDQILRDAVRRCQKNKPGKWEVGTPRYISIQDITNVMLPTMEGRRGCPGDYTYMVYEGNRKIFSVFCQYRLPHDVMHPDYVSPCSCSSTIEFY